MGRNKTAQHVINWQHSPSVDGDWQENKMSKQSIKLEATRKYSEQWEKMYQITEDGQDLTPIEFLPMS